jgi:hypothetical protein
LMSRTATGFGEFPFPMAALEFPLGSPLLQLSGLLQLPVPPFQVVWERAGSAPSDRKTAEQPATMQSERTSTWSLIISASTES